MGPGGSNPRFMLFWFHIHYSALSVIFLRYKCISICAKVVHIAYQPISAEIYLLATYSALAEIISCALYACRPTYILLRLMCSSQHICGHAFSDPADIYYFPHIAYWPRYIMCAQHVSADIYFPVLHVVQLTYIICRCKHTGRHILFVTVSIPANIYYPLLQAYWLNW